MLCSKLLRTNYQISETVGQNFIIEMKKKRITNYMPDSVDEFINFVPHIFFLLANRTQEEKTTVFKRICNSSHLPVRYQTEQNRRLEIKTTLTRANLKTLFSACVKKKKENKKIRAHRVCFNLAQIGLNTNIFIHYYY